MANQQAFVILDSTHLVRMIGGKSNQAEHETYQKDGTGNYAQRFGTSTCIIWDASSVNIVKS